MLLVAGPRHLSSPLRHPVNSREGIQPDITYSTGHHVATTWQVYCWQHMGLSGKFILGNTWDHVTCLYSATRGTTWQVYTRQHAGPRGKLMLGSTLHHLSNVQVGAKG